MCAQKQQKDKPIKSNNPAADEEHHHQQQHDLLLPFISRETPLGRHVLQKIEKDGYVVLPDILTASECARELNRLWDFIEATSPSVSRDRPQTWYPPAPYDDDDAGFSENNSSSSTAKIQDDPWPHSGWKFLPDMCQSYQAGWLFSDLREILADRVFQPLYGTRELHSSKEGFTFHRPTMVILSPPQSSQQTIDSTSSQNQQEETQQTTTISSVPNNNNKTPSTSRIIKKLVHPLMGQTRPKVCNKPSHTNGEHFDQRAAHTGLHCIQSSTALLDQTHEDGCFLCWPGSHKEHASMTRNIWRGRSDWVPLTDEECTYLRKQGYAPKRVPVRKGTVILWRSDLVHCGASPIGLRSGFRAVSYTCMLPAELTPDDVHDNKVTEYLSGLSGDHRPNVTMCHLSVPKKKKHEEGDGGGTHKTKKGEELRNPTKACGQYFKDGLPVLSRRQAELYGLVRYNSGGELPAEVLCREPQS